jgi:hypothetical protein
MSEFVSNYQIIASWLIQGCRNDIKKGKHTKESAIKAISKSLKYFDFDMQEHIIKSI